METTERKAELAARLEMVNPLAYVITRTRKRDVKEWRVLRDPTPEPIAMAPCEKEFYDAITERVVRYAMKRGANERFILATPQRQMSSSMAASMRAWLRRRGKTWTTRQPLQRMPRKWAPLTMEICREVGAFGDLDELTRCDTKYARVREMLQHYFREHPQEKVILFSTFRETLAYLHERLREDGIEGIVLHGGVSTSKDDILDAFRRDPATRILLSSEVGSEGIDLQFCRVLINYDPSVEPDAN